MGQGLSVGGAYFEITASAAPLLAALSAAESASAKSVSAIAQQLGKSEEDVQRLAQSWLTAEKQRADASAQSALKIIKAHNDAADAASKASGGFAEGAKSLLAFGVAASGVAVGAAAVHEALTKIITDTQAANQAVFALRSTFQGTTTQMSAFAEATSHAAGVSKTAGDTALAETRILAVQYGYTDAQIKLVLQRTADLSAATGVDLVRATHDSVAAMRLEGDAAESIGLNLQQNAIQAGLATKAERERYAGLDPLTKSQITFTKFLEQSSFAQGEAARRAGETTGAFDKLEGSTTDLAVALGRSLAPAAGAVAAALALQVDKSTGVVESLNTLTVNQTAAQKATEEQTQAWLRSAGAAGQFLGILIELNRTLQYYGVISSGVAEPKSGPQEPLPEDIRAIQQAQKVAEAAERDKQATIARIRKDARDDEAKAGIDAAQAEHDLAIKGLDDQKVILEVEKDQKLKAVESNKDAALKGIQAEADAAKEASDARIAHLHVEEQAAKQSATDKHDAAVAGIESESKAVADAVDENIHQLTIERDAAAQASEDKRDAALRALDDEKTARDAARTQEDRAAEDALTAGKRREEDRHQGAIRGLEDEVKAVNDRKDSELRALDEVAKRQQSHHEARLKSIEAESDAAHKQHDAAVQAIEDEGKAASDAHDLKLQSLSDEADADRAAAEQASRARDAAYEADSRARDTAHEATLRGLDEEADAAKNAADEQAKIRDAEYEAASRQRDAAHEAAVRGFEAEADAAKAAAETESRAREAVHQGILREIEAEADAAKASHDQALAEIDRLKDVEDDRHRSAMSAIDEEEKARQDAVDAQIAALDALDKADQQSEQDKSQKDKVTNAQYGLLQAKSTGNESLIVKAQQELDDALAAISHTQVQRERDTQRDTLKAQKDAIKDEEDARRDAENERNRQRDKALQADKDAADDALKVILAALGIRKDTENDTYAAASQAAKDALDKQLAAIDQRKRAEADSYAAAKQQAQDSYKAAVDAARDGLDKQLAAIAKRKQTEQDAYAAARQAAEDAYKAAKQAADDALTAQLNDIDKRKRAEDDAYKAGQDRRSAEKQQLDDALTKALDRIKREKDAEDDAYNNAKDKLDKRKVAIGDANKDELQKIADRKTAENDAHDNAVTKAQDQALQEKRAVADRRTAEDLADKAKRIEIQDAYTNEERDRHARYDDEATGEIPALHRALAAAQEHFRERKTAADLAYQTETHQIDDTYNNQEHGLIPLAQRAATAAAASFQAQTRAINEEAGKQKTAINDEYSNPGKTGLLDLLEKARADTDQKLADSKTYWDNYTRDIAGPQGDIKKIFDEAQTLIDQINKLHPVQSGGTGTGAGNLDDPSSHGGGPGPNVGSDGAPEPYAVSFPFGARYSNPFNSEIPVHRGVDMVVKGAANGGEGRPVSAFEDGTVVYNGFDPNGGNGIIIRGEDGLYHRYFHFDNTNVDMGQNVKRGDEIGTLGQTGTEGSPHLHYEVSKRVNGDPVGDLINPMPYLAHGGGAPAGGRVFEFDLFGRHFRFVLPGGAAGMELIRAIEALGEQIGGREFGRAAASVALSEGADGDLANSGSGGARGPYQFDPGGELANYATYLHKSIDAAGDYAGSHPLDAAAYALKGDGEGYSGPGYLGRAIQSGLANELRGADLAEYASELGQRPAGDLWKRAGDASRQLWGYANGGLIPEPTLLVGKTMGPYAMAGETGRPEWVTPHAPGQSGGPVEHMPVDISIGGVKLARLVVKGMQLELSRSGTLPGLT